MYRDALKLFSGPNPTAYTDSLALRKFLEASERLPLTKRNATIRFDCLEKAGILKQTYGSHQEAIALYRKAIASCFYFKLSDSLLFKPYLYCGTGHYFLHSFDSSSYYLKKAEDIYLKFSSIEEAQRLYNSFGAVYYEAGNYQQSINYFVKALQVNGGRKNLDVSFSQALRSNIASGLRRLNQYESAITIYKDLLSINTNRSEILINLGLTYLEKKDPDNALHYLRQVKGVDGNRAVVLENALANAYIQSRNPSEAVRHLNRALRSYEEKNTGKATNAKNKEIGSTYKLLGDVEQSKRDYRKALYYYQQSIIQLDPSFNDSRIYQNPADVTAGFRSYRLFESLTAKATCFLKLYDASPSPLNRQGTLKTYQSALKLAEYIEKSFNTEDARLFVVRQVFPVYQQAVSFLVRSYEQTNDQVYLEEAFRWAEKSKAATLYISLKENEIKRYAGIPDSLLSKERDLKFNQSRLLRKVDMATRDADVNALTVEIRENELALSQIADKLDEYPVYRRRKFSFDSVNVAYLQNKLLNRHTALLSYFEGQGEVYCFALTKNGISYHRFANDRPYRHALSTIGRELRIIVPGAMYQGGAYARFLYDRLIKPAEGSLGGISSLIIIPHNELGLLPFDALEDGNKTYLLERYNVTYQYAASFLQPEVRGKPDYNNFLAVAPFSSPGSAKAAAFAQLPASSQEIAALPGVKLRDRNATKANFIRHIRTASLIHLATHAVANSDDPSRSYIAFYPVANPNDNKLYAHELRNMPLSNTHLIFLSACETASGKLISGEGVMSVSRALSYAGCPSLVTSLWKAEDRATAYISTRFYVYVQQGYGFSEALQKAKLDLIRDGQYAQFHSPQYWSHLVFIGTPVKADSPLYPWLLAGLLFMAAAVTGWWLRYRR